MKQTRKQENSAPHYVSTSPTIFLSLSYFRSRYLGMYFISLFLHIWVRHKSGQFTMQSVSVAIPTGSREDVNKNWGPVELFSSTCSKYLLGYLSHEIFGKHLHQEGLLRQFLYFPDFSVQVQNLIYTKLQG